MDLNELISEFRTWGFDRRRWSDRTQELYGTRVAAAADWLTDHDCTLTEASEADLRRWLTTLPATASSRNLARKGLMWFFTFLVDRGIRDGNPTDRIDPLPEPRGLPRAMDNTDASRLYAASRQYGAMWAAVVAAMLYAGLRVSETVALMWVDVEGDWLHLTGKGGQQRVVPIADEFAAALSRWRPACTDPVWVFPSKQTDRHTTPSTVRRHVTLICESANIERVTPHQLRHTCGTRMAERGVDVRVIQQLLGHASLETTYRYLMVRNPRMVEAVGQLDWTRPERAA